MKEIFLLLFISFISLNSLSQELYLSTHHNKDSTLSLDYKRSDIFVGLGGSIPFRNYTPIAYDWMGTANLNIRIYTPLFFVMGVDICESNAPYLSSSNIYLGPFFRIHLIKSRLNFLINLGVVGIAGHGEEGLGFGICAFLTPELKYYITQHLTVGFQLKNLMPIGGRYLILCPIAGISVKL